MRVIKQALETLIEGHSLDSEQAADTMRYLMSGDATDAQIAGLLIALTKLCINGIRATFSPCYLL